MIPTLPNFNLANVDAKSISDDTDRAYTTSLSAKTIKLRLQ